MTVQRGTVITTPSATSEVYGGAVSVSGDGLVIAVGCQGYAASFSFQGAIRIYDVHPTTKVLTLRSQVVVATDARAGDEIYPCSLNYNGSILIVGSIKWEPTSQTKDYGGVYSFDYNAVTGLFVQRSQVLEAPAPTVGGKFGSAVTTDGTGNRIFVCAGFYAVSGAPANSSAVYVFDWNGTLWTLHSTIVSPYPLTNGMFGISLSCSDDKKTLVISERKTVEGVVNSGAIYTAQLNATTDIYEIISPTLFSEDPSKLFFGYSVSISGNSNFLAVYYGHNLGTVNIYYRAGNTWVYISSISNPLNEGGAFLFSCFNTLGDVLVAVGFGDVSYVDSGSLFVFDLHRVDISVDDQIDTDDYYADVTNLVTNERVNGGSVTHGVHSFVTVVDDPVSISIRPKVGRLWDINKPMLVGDKVFPDLATNDPYFYKCTVAGTTGAAQPAWTTTIGSTFVDNDVTWECVDNMEQPITQSPLVPVAG